MSIPILDSSSAGIPGGFVNPQVMPRSPSPLQYENQFPKFIYSPTGEVMRSTGRYSLKQDDRDYKDFYALGIYEQALYTYESSHGYADATYLVYVQREEWYTERRKISLRSAPAFKSIVDAMVGPVFEKEIPRETDNAMYEEFIENADNTGTTLNDMNESLQTHGRVCGVSFWIMDNMESVGESTLDQVMAERNFPYIYEKLPQEVHKWHTNNWGKLDSIVFNDKTIDISSNSRKMEMQQLYREWTATGWRLYYEKVTKDGKVEEITVGEGLHNLGVLPVYPVLDYVKSKNLTNFPVPPLRTLVNMAFILFNSRSLVKNLELYNFPILSLSNFDVNQLALGVQNALNSTGDSKFPPNFIVPPPTSIQVLTENCEKMEAAMYEYAQQHGYIAAKGTQTGIKAEWDFRGTNSVLSKTAYAAKKAEEWCIEMFGRYLNKAISCESDYPSEFSSIYSSNRKAEVLEAVKEVPPEPLSNELWKEYVTVFWDDDPDKAQEICDKIDAAGVLKEKTKPDVLLPEGEGEGNGEGQGGEGGEDESKPGKPDAKGEGGGGEPKPSALKEIIGEIMKKFDKGKK